MSKFQSDRKERFQFLSLLYIFYILYIFVYYKFLQKKVFLFAIIEKKTSLKKKIQKIIMKKNFKMKLN